MFLSKGHLVCTAIVCLLGMLANGKCVHHVKDKFDFKKSVFKVLVFDGMFSGFSCGVQLLATILLSIIDRGHLHCNVFFVIMDFCSFSGLVLALTVAAIR